MSVERHSDRVAGQDKIRPAILEHRRPGTSVKVKGFEGAGAPYDRATRSWRPRLEAADDGAAGDAADLESRASHQPGDAVDAAACESASLQFNGLGPACPSGAFGTSRSEQRD